MDASVNQPSGAPVAEINHERSEFVASGARPRRCSRFARTVFHGASQNLGPLLPLTSMRVPFYTLSSIFGMFAWGCSLAHDPDPLGDAGVSCSTAPPSCVHRSAGPCSPLEFVSARCADEAWSCPSGAFERHSGSAESCLPMTESLALLHAMGPSIEVGDRCVVSAKANATSAGVREEHVTVALPTPFSFRECLSGPIAEPVLDRGDVGPDVIVDLMQTIRVDGEQHSFVRFLVLDATAPFGVRPLGGQVVRHRADGSYRPTTEMMWEDGNHRSALVLGDAVYIYENGRSVGLVGEAIVYRTDARRLHSPAEWERWEGSRWGPGEPIAVIEVGPQFHLSQHDGRLLVLTVEGFGSEIMALTADAPEGPWRLSATHACELPADDPGAFCDSARAYPSMRDPERHTELVLAHRIGTTSADRMERITRNPEAYWGRLRFINAP